MRNSLALLALGLALVACGGPEKLGKSLVAGAGGVGAGGQGGFGPTGAAGFQGGAGTTGAAGTGAAGTGAAGTTGVAGTGVAGTGVAGTTGIAGSGGAGTGVAGTGAGGRAGTGGTPDAGTDASTDTAPPGCNCMLKVQYQCRQNGPAVGMAEYSIKIVNTGTTSISLNAVTVRYWYTSDGTGTQAGNCASAAHPCTIAFVNTTPKAKADHYAVISFGGGTLAAGADTGEISIQMQGMGTYMQDNDFSFLNTGANYADQPDITGYVAGRLIWGAAP